MAAMSARILMAVRTGRGTQAIGVHGPAFAGIAVEEVYAPDQDRDADRVTPSMSCERTAVLLRQLTPGLDAGLARDRRFQHHVLVPLDELPDLLVRSRAAGGKGVDEPQRVVPEVESDCAAF